MKELPILFSTEMVQALLEGRKTMTRRIIKDTYWITDNKEIEIEMSDNGKMVHFTQKGQGESMAGRVSKCQIGDLLWVRETFGKIISFDKYCYKADVESKYDKPVHGWKPSIFMPKEAARIWLRVTNVKCERLQDISEEDAIKEGIKTGITTEEHSYFIYPPKEKTKGFYCGPCRIDGTYVSKSSAFLSDKPAFHSYMSLWESINGSGSSKKNPWVFVYEFEVLSTKGKP